MNKTLYLKDDDGPVWDRARELAGDKLSPVIVDALKKFVAQKEAEAKSYDRIVVEFSDSDDHYLAKIKAFHGRWIYDIEKPLVDEDESQQWRYSVAETAKGNLVVYIRNVQRDGCLTCKFLVYPSFEEAAKDPEVNYAVRQALEKRGVPVEELDI